jgi:FkbM family methyltransferase
MDSVIMQAGPVPVEMLKGCRVTARAEKGQAFEPQSLAAWARLVVPGQVAIDVGAYTGIYAIAAAKLGARVYAFEPLTGQYERLLGNAFLNKVLVIARQIAISDENATAEFRYNAAVPLTSGGSLEGDQGQSIMVRTRRLSEFEYPGRVAAIKIDVERAEEKVLRGAAGMIERDLPEILVEVLEASRLAGLARLLPAGYRMAGLLDGRNAHLSAG